MSHEPDPSRSADAPAPDLSVILITPDTFDTIRRTTECLTRQSVRSRIELVIVAPESARIDVDRELVAPLAGVGVVRLASLTPSGPARAAGIRAARAPIVAFAEEHCFPDPDWAEALIAAHRGEHVAVGPAMLNANPGTSVSWADFLLGYGPWAAPVEREDREYLPGHNSSYKRAALLAYGDRLQTLMEAETVLMWDLRSRGHRLLLEPAAKARHTNFSVWSTWVRVMFLNGRAFADTRSASWSRSRRFVFAAGSPLIPVVRLARLLGDARRLAGAAPSLATLVPTLCTGLAADAAGQLAGYAFGAGTAHQQLAVMEWHRLEHTVEGRAAAG